METEPTDVMLDSTIGKTIASHFAAQKVLSILLMRRGPKSEAYEVAIDGEGTFIVIDTSDPTKMTSDRLRHLPIYAQLSQRMGVAVPAFQQIQTPSGNLQCYRKIPGKDLKKQMIQLDLDQQRHVVITLAHALRNLHDIPVREATGLTEESLWHNVSYYLSDEFLRKNIKQHVDDTLYSAVSAREPLLYELQMLMRKPSLAHCDLELDNILFDRNTGHMGIIDWEHLHIDDPDRDLWTLARQLPSDLLPDLLESYGYRDPRAFERKAKILDLWRSLYLWNDFYLEKGLVKEGSALIQKALDELCN